MPTPIDSKTFYSAIQSAVNSAKDQIKLATDKEPRIVIWALGYGHSELEIQIEQGYGEGSAKVSGRDFQQCVDEFIRRVRFENQQKTLQLGAPTVEG
jgi:hypothetical protein